MAEHLLSCSKPQDKKSICFTNDTGYSMPFPVNLDVEVYLHDIAQRWDLAVFCPLFCISTYKQMKPIFRSF